MNKFGRNYQLIVDPAQIANPNPQVIINYPLTIEFDICRQDLGVAGTAMFRIYNLDSTARSFIYQDPWGYNYFPIRFYAGYGSDLSLLFKGNIISAMSYRREGSVDFITEIVAQDGGYDITYAMSNFKVSAGTTKQSAINQLASLMTHTSVGKIGAWAGVYQREKMFIKSVIEELFTETGGNVFVDCEKLYVIGDKDFVDGDVPLISSATGLLGAPYRANMLTMAEMVFEPHIKVGQMVDLESTSNSRYNGSNKVTSLHHFGIISGARNGKLKTVVGMWKNGSPNIAEVGV